VLMDLLLGKLTNRDYNPLRGLQDGMRCGYYQSSIAKKTENSPLH
jgi:hypothetical protein